ncbi:carbon starvation CstA family protein [Marinobacter halodurans]|uniref:carbon starvation CstA family protein n=1 Tax=Marinobacter halodurans TaxID=2528979 RepID=UPI001A955F58|nr:carbon starvation CstA 5TM domain-containing protein [Marinobacter halodurans]
MNAYFRAARLILSDFLKFDQKAITKRLIIALPLFAAGFVISQMDFNVIWRYFGWANQMTAVIMLWAAASWLKRHGKFHWVCTIPATFMTGVVNAYLLSAEIGFGLPLSVVGPIGIASSLVVLGWLLLRRRREEDEVGAAGLATDQA